MLKFLQNKKTELILFLLTLGITIFLRFANYENRWTLNQDQARDAIIALEAIEGKKMPLLGPPSSAGTFSFGPIYYWFIIFFTYITKPLIFGPWIGFTLLSVASVILFYFLGRGIYGKTFAFVAGLIAAFASQDVINAPDMLNPMPVGFFTTLAFFSVVYLLKKKGAIYAIVLGFSIGVAINLHLQSLGLLTLIPVSILILDENFKKKLFLTLAALGGFMIAFLPLIYFDYLNKGVWVNSVLHYLAVGQNKFNVSVSLLNEFRSFWPSLWGETILNQPKFGFALVGLFITALYISFKKISSKAWIAIFTSFLIQALLLHFYKGPRMTVYLIVYHPYLIFFTAWSIWVIWKTQKVLGSVLLLILLSVAAFSDWQIIQSPTGQIPQVLKLKNKLESNQKGPFEVYSYDSSFNISLPIFYLLKKEGKISQTGTKIGICNHSILRAADLKNYIENCPSQDNELSEIGEFRIFKNPQGELFKITSEKIYSWIYDNYR